MDQGLCQGCFISHFPQPNRKICKAWKKSKKRKQESFWPFRIRGGAGKADDDDTNVNFAEKPTSSMVDTALRNAEAHGINLKHGVPSLGNGDCAFESVIDSINTRNCFDNHFDGEPSKWRYEWMTVIEEIAYEGWNGGLTKQQWKEGFDVLKQSGTYEFSLGD